MAQICSNFCEHFKKVHGATGKISMMKYRNFKYCRLCAVCFKDEISFICPCCKSNLHYRMKQYKADLFKPCIRVIKVIKKFKIFTL